MVFVTAGIKRNQSPRIFIIKFNKKIKLIRDSLEDESRFYMDVRPNGEQSYYTSLHPHGPTMMTNLCLN